jgi:hypothetical protein
MSPPFSGSKNKPSEEPASKQVEKRAVGSSQSHIATDGQSVGQSVCLGVELRLGRMTSH